MAAMLLQQHGLVLLLCYLIVGKLRIVFFNYQFLCWTIYSCCNITPTSNYAAMLHSISLYIVDVASMVPLRTFNAIDRVLRDTTANDIAFGGKAFLWGGDFRQVLPVVRHAHPSVTIENCINRNAGWDSVAKFRLKTNMMRVHPDEIEFSQWLLRLSNNNLPTKATQLFKGCIRIPHYVTESVVTTIFGDNFDKHTFADYVILCPTIDEWLKLNDAILDLLPGDSRTYFSMELTMLMKGHNIQLNS